MTPEDPMRDATAGAVDSVKQEPRCDHCGQLESWHSAIDGACSDSDGPHVDAEDPAPDLEQETTSDPMPPLDVEGHHTFARNYRRQGDHDAADMHEANAAELEQDVCARCGRRIEPGARYFDMIGKPVHMLCTAGGRP